MPSAYIRQRVEIRHPVDDQDDLALYDGGDRVCRVKLVDLRDNARTFKPRIDESAVSFASGKVRP